MIGAIGAEIDRIEMEIRQAVPGIRHIDLVSRMLNAPSPLSYFPLAVFCDLHH